MTNDKLSDRNGAKIRALVRLCHEVAVGLSPGVCRVYREAVREQPRVERSGTLGIRTKHVPL
jgi:hypothetical protein